MAIHYQCRHCGANIGSIARTSVHSDALGLHKLDSEERNQMVSYTHNGDIQITSICEDCQEAFEKNPELHQYDYLIH